MVWSLGFRVWGFYFLVFSFLGFVAGGGLGRDLGLLRFLGG